MNTQMVEQRLRGAAQECDDLAEQIIANWDAGVAPIPLRGGTSPAPRIRWLAAAVVVLVVAAVGTWAVTTETSPGSEQTVAATGPVAPADTTDGVPSDPVPLSLTFPDGTALDVVLPAGGAGWSVAQIDAKITVDGYETLRPFQVHLGPAANLDRARQEGGEVEDLGNGAWRVSQPGRTELVVVRGDWEARVLTTFTDQQLLPPALVAHLAANLDFTVATNGPVLATTDGIAIDHSTVMLSADGRPSLFQIDLVVGRSTCRESEGETVIDESETEGTPSPSITRCFIDGTVQATGMGVGAELLEGTEIHRRDSQTTTTPSGALYDGLEDVDGPRLEGSAPGGDAIVVVVDPEFGPCIQIGHSFLGCDNTGAYPPGDDRYSPRTAGDSPGPNETFDQSVDLLSGWLPPGAVAVTAVGGNVSAEAIVNVDAGYWILPTGGADLPTGVEYVDQDGRIVAERARTP